MIKSILIQQLEDGQQNMEIKGFEGFEVLGLLRFYEKYTWLKLTTDIEKQIKDKKSGKINTNG